MTTKVPFRVRLVRDVTNNREVFYGPETYPSSSDELILTGEEVYKYTIAHNDVGEDTKFCAYHISGIIYLDTDTNKVVNVETFIETSQT